MMIEREQAAGPKKTKSSGGSGSSRAVGKGAASKKRPARGPPPFVLLPALLHDYYTSAQDPMQVSVFDCECWLPRQGALPGVKPFSDNTPRAGTSFDEEKGWGDVAGGGGEAADVDPFDLTIPFCTRAEIGLNAAVELYLQRRRMDKMSAAGEDDDGDEFVANMTKKGPSETSEEATSYANSWCGALGQKAFFHASNTATMQKLKITTWTKRQDSSFETYGKDSL